MQAPETRHGGGSRSAARHIAELERMRAEFGASAPASLRGFIDGKVRKLRGKIDDSTSCFQRLSPPPITYVGRAPLLHHEDRIPDALTVDVVGLEQLTLRSKAPR